MRIVLALPLLLLAACQVTEDDANDSITVQYNGDVAANAVDDVVNGVQEAGGAIANSTENAVDRAQNVSVDVDIDANTADNSN